MARPKTSAFEQFGLVALDGGDLVPASVPAASNGQGRSILVDAFGRPWTRAIGGGSGGATNIIPGPVDAASSLKRSTGNGSPRVISTDPTKWYTVHCLADEKSWIMLFNAAAVPAIGSTPIYSFMAVKELNIMDPSSNLIAMGDFFDTGLVVLASGSPEVYAVPGGVITDYIVTVLYND